MFASVGPHLVVNFHFTSPRVIAEGTIKYFCHHRFYYLNDQCDFLRQALPFLSTRFLLFRPPIGARRRVDFKICFTVTSLKLFQAMPPSVSIMLLVGGLVSGLKHAQDHPKQFAAFIDGYIQVSPKQFSNISEYVATVSNAVAWGYYSEAINETGWGSLEIHSNSSVADASQAAAAGYLVTLCSCCFSACFFFPLAFFKKLFLSFLILGGLFDLRTDRAVSG